MPYLFAYIDDLLATSSSVQEHLEHLQLFSSLGSRGVINATMRQFGRPDLEFLGHLVDANGL